MPSRLSQREAIRDEEKTDVPALPLLAIRGFLCYRCLNHTDDLLKCSGCKRVGYCSTECQLADWHIQHKKQCKPLRKVNEIERCESDDEQSWDSYTDSLHSKAQVVRQNTADEVTSEAIQTVIGQPYCSTCHRSDIQIGPRTALKACEICHLVFTCEDCQSCHTEEECYHYRLLGEVEQYKLQCFEADSTVTASEGTVTPMSYQQYRPLSTVVSWREYYICTSDEHYIENYIESFVDPDFSLQERSCRDEVSRCRWLHLLLATVSMSIPLTVLSALEDSMPNFAQAETISVHLVGAAGKEFRGLKLFEEILHLLPSLRHLKVAIVGPESPSGFGQDIDLDCCPTCTAYGRRRTVTSYQGGYHEYANTAEYKKPDLAVLFHSGRSQANVGSWVPSTRYLVDSGTRTLCTTYTQREAIEEVAELRELDAHLIVEPEINKWRGLVPLPELLEGPEHGVYYNNFYRYVFQGR